MVLDLLDNEASYGERRILWKRMQRLHGAARKACIRKLLKETHGKERLPRNRSA